MSDNGLPTVAAISGGRTSGRMLRMLLDAGEKPICLFANTGKERDETLDFLNEMQTRWGVEIIWLEYRRIKTDERLVKLLKTEKMQENARANPEMHWFERVSYETAARHTDEHGPFDELLQCMSVLPNVRARNCTSQLKIKTMQRYLWSIGIYSFINAIGFRYDEQDRAADIEHSRNRFPDVTYRFPLIESRTTKPQVDKWWADNDFDLGISDYEGNCHLCFLKRKAVKQRLIREQPHLTKWWGGWERRKRAEIGDCPGSRWRDEKGHSIPDLEHIAHHPTLPFDDDDTDYAMECSCTAGDGLGVIYDDNC